MLFYRILRMCGALFRVLQCYVLRHNSILHCETEFITEGCIFPQKKCCSLKWKYPGVWCMPVTLKSKLSWLISDCERTRRHDPTTSPGDCLHVVEREAGRRELEMVCETESWSSFCYAKSLKIKTIKPHLTIFTHRRLHQMWQFKIPPFTGIS